MILPEPTSVHSISGWGDTNLHVPEFGNPDGPPLVLVHGWSQAHQSWARQISSPLADEYRLVVPDLRGHGSSAKPVAPENYATSLPWAHDIAALLDALSLEKPVLVGWSMGGWVVQDYLRHHGDDALAGISLVGSSVASGTFSDPDALALRQSDKAVIAADMFSPDLTKNIRSTTEFVKACFHSPLPADDLAFVVGFNMSCPHDIRAIARGRNEDHKPDLAKVSCPAIVQWGKHDRIGAEPMMREAQNALPDARLHIYGESGHAPFWDEAHAFNADLSAFVAEVQQ